VIERDELAAWLRLLQTPGLGRESACWLLRAFGSPQAVFAASAVARRAVVGSAADALDESAPNLPELVEDTLAWVDAAPAGAPRHVIALGDPRYPPALLETADPPLLLYAAGRVELLQQPSLAIVGSRSATPLGVRNARSFAAELSRAGLTIVSGLGQGIDLAAHAGALKGPAGTIAVVATGLDRTSHRRHSPLPRRITEEGLLLSGHPLGTMARPQSIPQPNRIIAGLSLGALVVEPAARSGSLITARLALEAGREVFVLPGSGHSPQSHGCRALLKQGAKPVATAGDILAALKVPPQPVADSADPMNDPLLDALGHDPVTLEALSARTGWPPRELAARLLELELQGRVARLPGQLFQRLWRA
jgi:DNA processing protein